MEQPGQLHSSPGHSDHMAMAFPGTIRPAVSQSFDSDCSFLRVELYVWQGGGESPCSEATESVKCINSGATLPGSVPYEPCLSFLLYKVGLE
jgi:hypothetical protein